MQVHNLKLDKHYFEAVMFGEKCFEVRRDDRGFQKGDHIVFHKYGKARTTPYSVGYLDSCGNGTSRGAALKYEAKITYILTGGQYGINAGYVVMGLKPQDTPNDT